MIMAETGSLLTMVGGFIAFSIMVSIGTIILGGATTDCTLVNDYNATAGATQTGWALQCESTQTQSQSGYALIGVGIIVLAAAIILVIVRMLG